MRLEIEKRQKIIEESDDAHEEKNRKVLRELRDSHEIIDNLKSEK